MKMISVAMARSVWLLDMNDLNPQGRSFLPGLINWLKERYSFPTVPSSPTDLDKQTNGLMFKAGEFQVEQGKVSVNLGIFTDGVTAETWSSTKDGDLFLDDALRAASNDFGLAYSPEIVRAKRYVSELIVRLDVPLRNINPKVDQLAQKLTKMFERANLPEFEFGGLAFHLDNSSSSYKPPGFVIERKLDAPFNEERYYSRSPFTTEEHKAAITDVERILRGDSISQDSLRSIRFEE